MLDEIRAQIQMERIVPFKTQTERTILVENSIGIHGGSKTDPLKDESGSYSLILQSKQWVTKDALPSIRKTGTIEVWAKSKWDEMGPP